MYHLIDNGLSLITTAIIALVTYYLAKFYINIKRYPPGPTPIPILGNVLMLKGTTRHTAFEIAKLRDKYGPVVTFWAGNKPLVFIFDLEMGKNAFKRSEFSGRPKSFFGELFSGDIVIADYGHEWESLRRVTHTAISKYSTTDKLAYLVSEVVEEVVNAIKTDEGIDKPFNCFDYTFLIFSNIMCSSIFCKRYTLADPEFKRIKYFFHDMTLEFGPKIALIEFMPIMRLFYRSVTNSFLKEINHFVTTATDGYRNHLKDYDENVIRDLSDALIFAKNEALSEGKEWAPYLKDHNLGMAIMDIFSAGISTSQNTLMWAILLMANYPEMQTRLRKEIESEIGDRMPVQNDRNRCHNVNAFLSETLRFRTIAPMGVFHKTMVDTEIGKQTIPKDTTVFIHLHHMQTHDQSWTNGDRFDPNRFLEANGEIRSSRPPAFVPFGTGRRVCIGEKMAIADLFLVIVRLLQLTGDYEICLENGAGSADFEPDPLIPDQFSPKKYNIVLKDRNK